MILFQILHQITHPQIPRFLACFEGKERLFLVQEFVKGKTYSQLLQERQQQSQVFSETEVVKWLMNMLPILTYIHQRGIIHRDISPDNIMQPQGEELPVLIDFGVGKLTNVSYPDKGNQSDSNDHSFVGKMSFVGKVGYAPREQISMGRCSPSSDLYALGVTAIVLLTGKVPTSLLDQYTLEWQWRNYTPTSDNLAEIIDKMIEDRPMQRYQAAEDIITSLLQLGQNRESILTSELTAITDAHFYEKIASFPGEHINDTTEMTTHDFVSSLEEETMINPAVTSQANSQDENSHLPVKEDTTPINTPQAKSTLPSQQKQSRSPAKSFSSPQGYAEPVGNSLDRKAVLEETSTPASESRNTQSTGLETKFINHCQQELAYIIGPMANLILEEILVQHTPSFPEELVNALAEQIPDTKQAIKFRQKLLS